MPSRVKLVWQGHDPVILRCRDVSESGVFLEHDGQTVPGEGTDVTLQVQDDLGDGEAPVVDGIVVRTALEGIGVLFK